MLESVPGGIVKIAVLFLKRKSIDRMISRHIDGPSFGRTIYQQI